MPRFVLIYRAATENAPVADGQEFAAWKDYLDNALADHAIDPGWPVREPARVLGRADGGTRLCGYSVIEAEDLDAAVKLAKHCPTLSANGGVEVGSLVMIER